MIEPLLLTTTQVVTFAGTSELTRATGFYFERDERLFLITSRHVLFDAPSKHSPDGIEIRCVPTPRTSRNRCGTRCRCTATA